MPAVPALASDPDAPELPPEPAVLDAPVPPVLDRPAKPPALAPPDPETPAASEPAPPPRFPDGSSELPQATAMAIATEPQAHARAAARTIATVYKQIALFYLRFADLVERQRASERQWCCASFGSACQCEQGGDAGLRALRLRLAQTNQKKT
jgi:hypothetical protein